MTKFGYARVSTIDQDLSIQKETLNAFGCDMVRAEQMSGTTTQGRKELRTILDFIRQGDSLVVTRVDRLARSLADLQDIVRELRNKGASLIVTEQNVDTSTPAGKAFFDMLGVFAEFETNLRKERQLEGIARAKQAGVYKAVTRISKHDPKAVVAAYEKHGATTAARELGIARSEVYRMINLERAKTPAAA